VNQPTLEQAILDLIGRPDYRPAKPRAIARRLGVPKDRAAEVKKLIKRLVSSGQLTYGPGHLVEPPRPGTPRGNRVVGVFRRMSAGYGFVRPSGAAPEAERAGDVYIPAKRAGDASTGDVVVVRLSKRPAKRFPGPRGEIVEVLDRQTHQFVGTYFEQAGTAYVQVDGTLFTRPICVGDPGAKDAVCDDKVVFEMVRFPSHLRDGEGVITEVLGPRGKPGVDTLSIIRELNLPEQFAADAPAQYHLTWESPAAGARRFAAAIALNGARPAERFEEESLAVEYKTTRVHVTLGPAMPFAVSLNGRELTGI